MKCTPTVPQVLGRGQFSSPVYEVVSLQAILVKNSAVSLHYFLSGLALPSHLHSFTALAGINQVFQISGNPVYVII